MTIDRAFQIGVMLFGVYSLLRSAVWLTRGEYAAAYVWLAIAGTGVAAFLFSFGKLDDGGIENQLRAQEVAWP